MMNADVVPLREVPVDWEALEDAFENNAPSVHSYLHVGTGDVLRVVDGVADPDMHARIARDSVYMRIDAVNSREQYRWMERFIPMVEDEELREDLLDAIDGKGAFRRFKDVLMAHAADRDAWFAFRSERLRVFMEAWLAARGLTPVVRLAPPTPVVTELDAAPISQSQLSGLAGISVGRSREQLSNLVESLAARDLEKVLAFAEFVRARA